jgi:hypothetical protein
MIGINLIRFLHSPSWEGCFVVELQIIRKEEKSTALKGNRLERRRKLQANRKTMKKVFTETLYFTTTDLPPNPLPFF